jgi:hypothetical protein
VDTAGRYRLVDGLWRSVDGPFLGSNHRPDSLWGIRALTGRSARPVAEESAIEIARRRYARGEITKEEFEEIEATLTRG